MQGFTKAPACEEHGLLRPARGFEAYTVKKTLGNICVPVGDCQEIGKGGFGHGGGCSCPLGTRWTEVTSWQDDCPISLLDATHGG